MLFVELRLGADQQVEMRSQVASQQGFVWRDVEQKSERFDVEPRLQNLQSGRMFRSQRGNALFTVCCSSHHEGSMNATASQVRGVFSQIHRSEPLHHSVVGPLGDLCRCDVVLDTKY